MGNSCPPLVVDLFLFCYEMDIIVDKHTDIIGAFNTTSRYLDDILNVDNIIF